MITDIPTSQDFTSSALDVLHLAWNVSVDAVREFENMAVLFDEEFEDWKPLVGAERERAEAAFIASSQTSLANALTLIQQSVELALKGRIAEVSPWLLIIRDPRDLPRHSATQDVSFSAFRTVDAADLLRIHNTVSLVRMTAAFGSFWDQLRQDRNAVIHRGKGRSTILAPSLLAMILRVNASMFDGESWARRRRRYHDNDFDNAYPVGAVRPDDGFGLTSVVRDIDIAVRHLEPAELKEYVSYDTRTQAYLCPCCNGEVDSENFIDHPNGFPRLAQLTTGRSPDCITIRCIACERISDVIREPCPDPECKSTVLSASQETIRQCLLCGSYPEDVARYCVAKAQTAVEEE